MTGVVDQDIDGDATLAEPLVQLDDGRDVRQINLLHDDLGAEPAAQILAEGLEPVQPAGNQNEGMALLGILAGELLAETARCAGNENP
jgi:hypothetical protein